MYSLINSGGSIKKTKHKFSQTQAPTGKKINGLFWVFVDYKNVQYGGLQWPRTETHRLLS